MALDDDERRNWLPLVAIGVIIVGLAVGLLVVSRQDENGNANGTLPGSFPAAATTISAPPTTPPPSTPAATVPAVTVGPTVTIARGSAPTPTDDPAAALTALAADESASETTDIVRIGSSQYAMLVVSGSGNLVRWDGSEWRSVATVDPPGTIDTVQTADVTGDGEAEFILSLGGLDNPGGVYGQLGFSFDFLPFNTTTGLEDFVDGLELRFGQLQSPFRDASGTRTLIWTWTGRMFETQ
jgi:hypothetical protein